MKKNAPLIFAIAVPIIMIAAVALSIYIPRLTTHPNVKFLYTSSQNMYGYDYQYAVSDGKLVAHDNCNGNPSCISTLETSLKNDPNKVEYPQLYLYDATTDSSKTISQTEAMSLSLDSSIKSVDGYTVGHTENYNGLVGMWIFGGPNSDYNSIYLKKGSFSRKLVLDSENNGSAFYFGSFGFLGWVTNK